MSKTRPKSGAREARRAARARRRGVLRRVGGTAGAVGSALVVLALVAALAPTPKARARARGLADEGRATQGQLPRGEVVESVAVEADARQTYALYLPASYTPTKRYPVIYAFDPVGRGHLPVALLSSAAERFGYVVVGSNDSRNGLQTARLAEIINALWQDTHARLSLDPARTYAAGFSGGARVANRLAMTCKGCVAGVISCGAGFPPDMPPASAPGYAFYGTVGVDDFNFREMRPLARALDALGATARLATFEGRHQWCPEDVCTEGVEWMELLAMKDGRRAKDDALIDAALARLSARAESFKSPADAYERYATLRTIAQTFAGLRDVARFGDEAESLKRSKEFKSALAEERRQIEEEQRRAAEISTQGSGLLDDATHDEALVALDRLLAPLRDASKLAADSGERRVARRTLAHVYAESLESAQFLYEPRKDYRYAAANLELATHVFPDFPQNWLELARAYALGGRRDRALEALSRAVEKGFSDADAAARDEAFASLRADKKFQRLLERMKGDHKPREGNRLE